ncbi:DsbA family protein [Sphingomonas sp. BGYR3]|uniref:DsbA family protein n=1 Tax=Sphingomonas sp. BGYR3 TaxID=2975483 RepID=UPI0021A88E0C|nr:DsbA family protein [Sphingomonas sp. BGYR3]MDG5488631.1 DsbA family protein [Sphingomonas sp. BGYR3]
MRKLILALPLVLVACGGGAEGNVVAEGPVEAAPPPAGQNWTTTVARTPEGGVRLGNPNAPLKLVEYGSRTCPTCARFALEGMEPLKANYISTGKVSFEFREFPVHGVVDLAPILLGNCVPDTAFFPVLDQMMANQSAFIAKQSTISEQRAQALQNDPNALAAYIGETMGYVDFIKQRGVPEAKAKACLADKAAIERLTKQTQAATTEFKVNGTPAFLLNGRSIDASAWSQVEAALKAAGA